jgi:hypothetical protein
LMISSALTVRPMKMATMTDMKIYTGRLLFSSKGIPEFIGYIPVEIATMKASRKARKGSFQEIDDQVLGVASAFSGCPF